VKRKLFIYGAGGLGREILSMVKMHDDFEPAGFIDDVKPSGTLISSIPVIGGAAIFASFREPVEVIVAIGDPASKEKAISRINNPMVSFPVLKHPSALLQDAESIVFGEGTVVCAGSILTTNIGIGRHGLINLNVTIGHDVHVGDFCSVMPSANIAGEVQIGKGVLIGSGANVRNRIRIGDYAVIGMGAVVVKNVLDGKTVVGVPAKPIS
jgi:sugar O-acyltransferase (sialic acid O-acetyltransferase NeuD family)